MNRPQRDNRILAGGSGKVVGTSNNGVTSGKQLPTFILMPNGDLPKSLGDLTQIPGLDMCTVDLWFKGKHRRATNVTWEWAGPKLTMITMDPIVRREGKRWVTDQLAHLNHYLLTTEFTCVATYTDTGLMWYTATTRMPNGTPVQFALYPSSYEVGPGKSQVTHWLNDASPAFGTADW
ncbi:MAG: hypothetical protein WCI89_01620 [bacterium]